MCAVAPRHNPWLALIGVAIARFLGCIDLTDASGVAMGMSWTLHNLAGALGLAVTTLVLQHVSGDFVAGYQQVMTVLASVSVLVLPGLLVLLRKGPVGCAQATA